MVTIWMCEKVTCCQFFKVSSLARKSFKFCKNVVAVWNFFMKLPFYHLVRVSDHLVNDHFVHF